MVPQGQRAAVKVLSESCCWSPRPTQASQQPVRCFERVCVGNQAVTKPSFGAPAQANKLTACTISSGRAVLPERSRSSVNNRLLHQGGLSCRPSFRTVTGPTTTCSRRSEAEAHARLGYLLTFMQRPLLAGCSSLQRFSFHFRACLGPRSAALLRHRDRAGYQLLSTNHWSEGNYLARKQQGQGR